MDNGQVTHVLAGGAMSMNLPLSMSSLWVSQPLYTAQTTMTAALTDSLEQQLVAHRDYLLRFARLQLRNEAWAEDAVSETVLAALTKPQSFDNRSQLKTWLVGILKHKVIDALRHHSREVCGLDSSDDDDTDPLEYLGFKADGHFSQAPAEWGNPEQQITSRQFFEVLDACTNKLPAAQARLFLMREWLELSSEEICKELGLTQTNVYVQLHRARLRLRECLELNWFAQPHTR
jgi:RNA polymerase sigma-70 factor (ECF subfamily)